MPEVLEMALSTFEKPVVVLSISTLLSRCASLKLSTDMVHSNMDVSISALHKTFSLVNVASEHHECFNDAKKKQPRKDSFPTVIHGYVEALTKSYQQFRIPQELPVDEINRLYAQCGQVYEKWAQGRRSEVRAVVKKEAIATQMGKLKKEEKALTLICRGAADGHVWFKRKRQQTVAADFQEVDGGSG